MRWHDLVRTHVPRSWSRAACYTGPQGSVPRRSRHHAGRNAPWLSDHTLAVRSAPVILIALANDRPVLALTVTITFVAALLFERASIARSPEVAS